MILRFASILGIFFLERDSGQSTVGSGQFVSLENIASNQNLCWEEALLRWCVENRMILIRVIHFVHT